MGSGLAFCFGVLNQRQKTRLNNVWGQSKNYCNENDV